MPRLTSSSSVRRSSRAASFKEVSTVWPSMMTCQLALRYCAKGDDNTAYLTESFDVSQSRTFPVKAQHSSDQRMGYWLLMGVSPNIGPQALLVSCTTCADG